MSVWGALRDRNLIGSDAAIVLTCALHLLKATVFLTTSAANGSIGMASLLMVFQRPWIAAAVLFGAAVFAVIGEWMPSLSRYERFTLLLPQLSLLFITSLGAISFVAMQHYADGVYRAWPFILCDQIHRIGMPIWYATAIIARVRD